tara:strand:+ start:27 stop:548 length:522 start_codon:yes stop_codon:yes gene_type:complete
MENKYNQGKIYKLVCNITNEIYYGSTIETLKERLRKHNCFKDCVSRNILERGDYEMILIKDYPCNSKWELEEEEGKYIRENKCINIVIPHRTMKEWYEDNKENQNQRMKKWREDNSEYLKEYEKNRPNKKERYEKKNIYNAEKITCECGCIIRRDSLAKHRRNKKHIDLINKI